MRDALISLSALMVLSAFIIAVFATLNWASQFDIEVTYLDGQVETFNKCYKNKTEYRCGDLVVNNYKKVKHL